VIVKTLPDNPSVEHLRRQAKDLLAGLRDSDPSASLSTAQAALAGQYGFGSWAELRAEADRLSGSAEVADPAVARTVATRYGLGDVTGEMRSLAPADHLGRLWSLRTGRGRWAVRAMDGWSMVLDPEREVVLQEAAAKAGVLLPEPVRATSGAVVEEFAGKRWRVWRWLHSGPPLSAPASAAVTGKVGEILAILHELALPADRISPWLSARFSDVPWNALAEKAKDAPWAGELRRAVPNLVALEAIPWEPAQPVYTHTALIPGNVSRDLVVTGWEHSGGLPPAWELCQALMTWAVDPVGRISAAGARALAVGYGSAVDLSPGMFRGAVVALANYVFGQVQLALHERSAFHDRNVRHLLAHLPTPSTLEQLLEVSSAGRPRRRRPTPAA
jgi:hypothetical protein